MITVLSSKQMCQALKEMRGEGEREKDQAKHVGFVSYHYIEALTLRVLSPVGLNFTNFLFEVKKKMYRGPNVCPV